MDGCPLRTLLYNAYLLHGIQRLDNNAQGDMVQIIAAFKEGQKEMLKRNKRREELAQLEPMPWRAHRAIAEKMARKLSKHIRIRKSLGCPCKDGVISRTCDKVWSPQRWYQWWTGKLRRKGYADHQAKRHVDVILESFYEAPEPQVSAPKRGMRMCSQNFNSLNQNGFSFFEGLDPGIDVVAGQESRLGKGQWTMRKHCDWKLVDFPREDTSGGTCFLLRNNLIFESLKPFWRRLRGAANQPGVEWVWVKVKMENGWLYMASVYAPVSTTVPKSREAALILREQVDAFLQEDDCVGVLVSGDFNATWYPESVTLRRNMGSSGSTPRGKGREWRAALTGGSVVVNDSLIRPDDEAAVDPSIWATRLGTNNNQSTLIDYGVWFGPADKVTSVSMKNVEGPDHRSLVVELNDLCAPTVELEHFNFSRLQDEAVRENFQIGLTEALAALVDPPYDEWMATLKQVLREVCGVRRRRSRLKCSHNKWWSCKLGQLTSRKKKWQRLKWRLANRGLDLDVINQKLKIIKKRIRRELSKAQERYWRNIKEQWDLKGESMGQAFGILRRSQRKGADVQHSRRDMEASWSEVFSPAPPQDCQEDEARHALNQINWDNFPEDVLIDVDELSMWIAKLPNGKASGGDGIPNEVLKALPDAARELLCTYFNHMLRDPTTIPVDWYTSLVVMIPKEEDPAPLDYRPITLLSCVAKCLEKVLWERIKLLNIQLHFNQGGFVEDRGCPEQGWLLKIVSDALRAANVTGVALFLDIVKAYDCVPHHILIRRLREDFPTLPHYIVLFCFKWIQGHVRQILVDGSPAADLAVGRGLPQGSILAPFLFNCFINCLITRLKQALEGIQVNFRQLLAGDLYELLCKVLGFADDLCVTAMSSEDLQRALDVCESWARENGIRFNPSKCKFMNIGKATPSVRQWALSLADEQLECAKRFKYLGVMYSASKRYKFLDSTRFLEVIRDVELKRKFVIYDSCHGCPLFVGLVIISLRWLPQLLYGAELFPVNSGRTNLNHQSIWGSLGKRVLGAYRTDSTAAVLTFLGLRDIADYRNKRIIKFTLKMLTCRFDELRIPMLAVLDSELPWAMDIKQELHRARNHGMFVVHDANQDDHGANLLEDWDLNNLGAHLGSFADHEEMNEFFKRLMKVYNKQWELQKPRPHPAVWHAPINGHIAFRFLSGRFQPLDQQPAGAAPDNCVLCEEPWGDTPSHLPVCADGKVQAILNLGMQKCGLDHGNALSREAFVAFLKEPTTQRFNRLGVAPEMWESVCKTLRNLWHLRTRQWKRNRGLWIS